MVPCNIWATPVHKNYLVLTWNSDLTGCPAFHLGILSMSPQAWGEAQICTIGPLPMWFWRGGSLEPMLRIPDQVNTFWVRSPSSGWPADPSASHKWAHFNVGPRRKRGLSSSRRKLPQIFKAKRDGCGVTGPAAWGVLLIFSEWVFRAA